MGAVFSSARGGDVLRHWAETFGLILQALRNSALTGTFGPCVSIPGAGRWQSWGNAVNSPGFTHTEQAGLSPDGSVGIRDVPSWRAKLGWSEGLREQLFTYSLVFLATQTHKSTYLPKPPNSGCVSNPALLFSLYPRRIKCRLSTVRWLHSAGLFFKLFGNLIHTPISWNAAKIICSQFMLD